MCNSSGYCAEFTSARAVLACAALALTTACQRTEEPAVAQKSNGEFEWARTALARNPDLEVVAADGDSKVFTVRNRQTGEVSALKLGDVAAAPLSQFTRPVAPPVAPVEPPSPAPPGAPAATAAPSSTQQAAERTAATQEKEEVSQQQSAPTGQTPGYTIERSDGQVRVSGPGVSIVSSEAPSARSSSESTQRAIDPIICEGRRMLQLDSRDIYVQGAAITVRGGCELYITNSRVIGTEVGVVIEDAIVHIANSYIEGATASFVANHGARVFARNSTFQGVSRRAEQATVQDQGGNRWR